VDEVSVDVTVSLDRLSALTNAEHDAVKALSRAVYPPEEWADWPGRHVEWVGAEWCIRIWSNDGLLVHYTGILVRQATHDERSVRVGGIGGVKTHPAARRRSYAALAIRRAVEFFHAQADVAFALLVCEPGMMAYYSRLGWQEFNGRVVVRQHAAVAEFTFNRVMVCGVQSAAPLIGTIDLLGPPW